MKISDRANEIHTSLTRQLFNMAAEYDDVIDLTLGDPDLAPPKVLCDSAYQAMLSNKLHYSANAGLLETRRAISTHIKKNWNISADATSQIAVTVGGMEALYLSLLSVINPGDEVIIFAPYYVNYIQMISICGGVPTIINAYDKDRGFVITADMIESAITDKTVAIMVNSPNNPTGDIIGADMLAGIANVAERHDLVIISDEVYRTLIYDGANHQSILQFENAKSRTILIDSMSKEYSMTGWRIGYAFGPAEIITAITKLQENVASCATLSSQYALITAYNENVDSSYIVEEFEKRRNFLADKLKSFDMLQPLTPKGTFYMFINISKTGMRCDDFAYKLLREAHIAVVPGISYGDMFGDYIRVAFTKELPVLEEAVSRLEEFFRNFRS